MRLRPEQRAGPPKEEADVETHCCVCVLPLKPTRAAAHALPGGPHAAEHDPLQEEMERPGAAAAGRAQPLHLRGCVPAVLAASDLLL